MGSADDSDRMTKRYLPKKGTYKKHFWVPPPALTSPGKKNLWVKGRKRAAVPLTKKEHTSDDRTELVDQLEGLLDEIRRVKSAEYPKRDTCTRRTEGETDAMKDSLGEKSAVAVAELVTKDGGRLSLVSGRHSLLVERLKRIEEDATEAVQHVTAIRRIVKQLNHEAIPISERSTAQLEKRKELLSKLARLDDANRSLQNLISGISVIDETQAVEPLTNRNNDQLEKYKSELKSLQERAQADRREILNLKTELSEMTAHFNAEKQSLKADVNSHRERANKYLSDFEAVSSRLNEKNEELNRVMIGLEKQRLHSSRLNGEHASTKFENRTLQSKLNALEDKLREEESSIRTEMNKMESNFHEMSSKATVLELENSKLKLTLAGMQSVVSKQKSEIERLEKELENSLKSRKPEFPYTKNESIQVELIRGNSFAGRAAGDQKIEELGSRKLTKETELYIEKEKTAILQQLKQLNKKLEMSDVLNAAFRKELIAKEEIMIQNNSNLQEKISECKNLRESLEAAMRDVRELSSSVQKSRISDQLTQSKFNELEKTALQYRTENDRLRKQKDQLERKFTSEIEEMHGQLENLRSANGTLQEYVNFLRTSYADVFGEFSLRAG